MSIHFIVFLKHSPPTVQPVSEAATQFLWASVFDFCVSRLFVNVLKVKIDILNFILKTKYFDNVWFKIPRLEKQRKSHLKKIIFFAEPSFIVTNYSLSRFIFSR